MIDGGINTTLQLLKLDPCIFMKIIVSAVHSARFRCFFIIKFSVSLELLKGQNQSAWLWNVMEESVSAGPLGM